MRMKTKGRLAVTAMIDLAPQDGECPVALTGISRRQDISMSYLAQLFGRLRRHGLVESVRGPGGGYRLCRPPKAITVADIVAAVDGLLAESDPANAQAGSGEWANRCVTRWPGFAPAPSRRRDSPSRECCPSACVRYARTTAISSQRVV